MLTGNNHFVSNRGKKGVFAQLELSRIALHLTFERKAESCCQCLSKSVGLVVQGA